MNPKPKFITLSKSKIKQGLNCHKALYFSVHQAHLAKYSSQSQKAFSTGMEVGKIARTHFPGGILIKDYKWKEKMNSTLKAISQNQTIFEGTFSFNQIPIQVDILKAHENKTYDLIEVKSGLSAKDEYLEDAAIQFYVLENLKIPINEIFIWFVNRKATSEQDLFCQENVTEAVKLLAQKIPQQVKELMEVIKDELVIPNVEIGSHCVFPYECPYKHICWKKVPSENSIFQIPNFSDKWIAFKEGIISIDDPRLKKFNINPEVITAIKENKLWASIPHLYQALQKFTFPLNSLDFETFQVSIPKLKNTHPYQQIPFQFSLHTLDKGEVKHFEYLHQTNSDPRRALAEALVEFMPATGTVLAYNAKFEAQVCQELADLFPDLKDQLLNIVPRLFDPWLLLKDHLYHPAFKASYSLKSVAPALLGVHTDYNRLTIKDGLEAQAAYLKMVSSENLMEKINLNKALREYCQADTLNLIKLIQFLAQLCSFPI